MLFSILFAAFLGWVISLHMVTNCLFTSELDTFNQLGRPSVFPIPTVVFDIRFRLLRFITRREHVNLQNPMLSRRCDFFLYYTIVLLLYMAVSFWFV